MRHNHISIMAAASGLAALAAGAGAALGVGGPLLNSQIAQSVKKPKRTRVRKTLARASRNSGSGEGRERFKQRMRDLAKWQTEFYKDAVIAPPTRQQLRSEYGFSHRFRPDRPAAPEVIFVDPSPGNPVGPLWRLKGHRANQMRRVMKNAEKIFDQATAA